MNEKTPDVLVTVNNYGFVAVHAYVRGVTVEVRDYDIDGVPPEDLTVIPHVGKCIRYFVGSPTPAPDSALLSACKALLQEVKQMHEYYCGYCPGGCPSQAVVDEATAAIAKGGAS